MKKIGFIFILISLIGCESGTVTEYKLKVHGKKFEEVKKLIKKVKREKLESRKIVLHQLDSTSLMSYSKKDNLIAHNDGYFEMRDEISIHNLRHFLKNNIIKRYSSDMAMFDYCGILTIGGYGREVTSSYTINENWFKDSVVFVPDGFQSYVSMSQLEWQKYVKRLLPIYPKKYEIKRLETARKAYKYIKENGLNVNSNILVKEKYEYDSDLNWLNYEGRFFYRLEPSKEDYIGNKEKIRLKNQYPEEDFNVTQYCPFADLNIQQYTYEIMVHCNKEFYNKFSTSKSVSNWIENKGYLEVFADSLHLLKIDSIYGIPH